MLTFPELSIVLFLSMLGMTEFDIEKMRLKKE
jgi:hypothetical protein